MFVWQVNTMINNNITRRVICNVNTTQSCVVNNNITRPEALNLVDSIPSIHHTTPTYNQVVKRHVTMTIVVMVKITKVFLVCIAMMLLFKYGHNMRRYVHHNT